VSDEKIGLEYKIKRMLDGSLLDPVEAHLFWNGTFSRAGKEEILLDHDPGANPLNCRARQTPILAT